MKKEIKTCSICNLTIDTLIDHHLILTEKRGNRTITISNYHAQCFSQKFLIQQQMKEALGNMTNMFQRIKEMNS